MHGQQGWIKSYAATIIQLIVFIVILAMQWATFTAEVSQGKETRKELERHLRDKEIHIDPNRDKYRWEDVGRRLERIERKLDDR